MHTHAGGSSWSMVFAVLASAAVTCLLLYGLYSHYLQKRMHSEMRDIMAQVCVGGRGGVHSKMRDLGYALLLKVVYYYSNL